MRQYIPNPIPIEAIKYKYPASKEIREWLSDSYYLERKERYLGAIGEIEIRTVEDEYDTRNWCIAKEGDYIVKHFNGQFRVFTANIFEKTYSQKEGNSTLDNDLAKLVQEFGLSEVLSVLAMQQESNLKDLIFAPVRYMRDYPPS